MIGLDDKFPEEKYDHMIKYCDHNVEDIDDLMCMLKRSR